MIIILIILLLLTVNNIEYFGKDNLSTIIVIAFFILVILSTVAIEVNVVKGKKSIRQVILGYLRSEVKPVFLFVITMFLLISLFVHEYIYDGSSDITEKFEEVLEQNDEHDGTTEFLIRNSVFMPRFTKEPIALFGEGMDTAKALKVELDKGEQADKETVDELEKELLNLESKVDSTEKRMEVTKYLLIGLIIMSVIKRFIWPWITLIKASKRNQVLRV